MIGPCGEHLEAVPPRELLEVSVQDEAGAVPLPPRLPRGDDDDTHERQPTLAVVIATRDRPHLLDGLLAALAAGVDSWTEIVVVDSASSGTATRDVCAAHGVRVVRLDIPGTSRARNAGVAATAATVVAFTDDDCLPTQGWGGALLGAFADPAVGLVTGQVVADRETAAPVSLQLEPDARDLRPDDVIGHGANAAVRRTAFLAVGGFDERLGPGAPGLAGEDQDLFRRLLAAGWGGRYEPAARVVHRQWRGRGAALGLSFAYGFGQVAAGGRLREAAWRDGVRAAARDARAGYASGVVAGVLRAAGACAAAARGSR